MSGSLGRFTARGGVEVEQKIEAMVSDVANVIRQTVPETDYRALVMLGGYGRGEGGVEVRNGCERPHNNLDFLLITQNLDARAQQALKSKVDGLLQPLRDQHDIAVDFSTTAVSKLLHSPCLVIWYDMRFGHKTILGDAHFLPSLERYRVDRILPSDARNLLVNRGTLLVINDLLFDRGDLSEEERRVIVRHGIKAIIGYGDALLFFLGNYHWSYAEKQRRMARQLEVSPEFRQRYHEAMEFRFSPNYSTYLARDLRTWAEDLRGSLQEVHLQCERARLGNTRLTWHEYAEKAFRHLVFEEATTLRAIAKKGVQLMRGSPSCGGLSWSAQIGYRCGGTKGALPIIFPVMAYRLDSEKDCNLARTLLGASDTTFAELRRAYLFQWSRLCDANFASVMEKFKLSLER